MLCSFDRTPLRFIGRHNALQVGEDSSQIHLCDISILPFAAYLVVLEPLFGKWSNCSVANVVAVSGHSARPVDTILLTRILFFDCSLIRLGLFAVVQLVGDLHIEGYVSQDSLLLQFYLLRLLQDFKVVTTVKCFALHTQHPLWLHTDFALHVHILYSDFGAGHELL